MKVVNCTRETCTHYCGRQGSIHKAKGKPSDLSILCNPEPMRDNSQEERKRVVEAFRRHLWVLIKTPRIRQMILDLPEDAALGCFCAPLACHCDVIIDCRTWLLSQQAPASAGNQVREQPPDDRDLYGNLPGDGTEFLNG